jgi:hypothetical protein
LKTVKTVETAGRYNKGGTPVAGGDPCAMWPIGAISASALPPAADPTALEGGEDFSGGCVARDVRLNGGKCTPCLTGGQSHPVRLRETHETPGP